MYDRVNPNRFGFKDSFLSGVGELVNKAMEQPQFLNHGEITCPCVNCKCIDLKMPSEVRHHLYQFGFMPNYYICTEHGKEDQCPQCECYYIWQMRHLVIVRYQMKKLNNFTIN
jgi:hypothetical protein